MKQHLCSWWRILILCAVVCLVPCVMSACGQGTFAQSDQAQNPPSQNDATNQDDESPHQHQYGAWLVKIQPSCTRTGLEQRFCVCGAYETRDLDLIPHDDHEIARTAPTCTTAGSVTMRCASCGATYTQTLDALGHQYAAVNEIAPTCTDEGYTVYTCQHCYDSYHGDLIPAHGHDYPPTDEHTHTCQHCGNTYTDAPIDDLAKSFWYLENGKWALNFETCKTIDEHQKSGTYISYRYTLENGVLTDTPANYAGNYELTSVTANGVTTYFIYLHETNATNMGGHENEANHNVLTYVVDTDADGKPRYTLTAKYLMAYENRTLIFAGYDL